ncbi:unnamed protein product [Zymoseptoria tritici ST99CH_1A5]|uniref:Uncharacterized protein n=1 Tax=Zymoseptoria tritici ST99CH_1A5 TaxID=1276529 RepID=A0A1Y6M3S8_ZYMTR|nr:unnamed protein product [Zymoseptoria tritici ST99CH_1A5]
MNPILNRTGSARRDVEVRRRRRTSQCRSTHDRGMAWTDRGTRCGVCGQNCDDEEDVVVIVVEFRRCQLGLLQYSETKETSPGDPLPLPTFELYSSSPNSLSQAAKRAVEDILNDRKHYPKPVPAHTERRTEERMKGTPSREGQASRQEITKEDKHEHLEGDKASIFVIPKRRSAVHPDGPCARSRPSRYLTCTRCRTTEGFEVPMMSRPADIASAAPRISRL